jgi:fibronectin type 3 domain-containing protein
MRRFMIFILLTVMSVFTAAGLATTPGKHTVVLTWSESTTGVTFNVYRGTSSGVCSGTPTPYATGVTLLTYTDTSVVEGTTYFYAVSAVKGGESACSSEAQASVPISPAPPTNLQVTVQ